MAKIISVISGKGGTGKSTVAAALSLSLAKLGCSVLAADMDTGLRSLDLLLGMENKLVFDLGDVEEGRCDLAHAMAAHDRYPHLRLVCAPADVSREFRNADAADRLRDAAREFDYLILDLPAGIGASLFFTGELADLAVIVTVPELVTLRDSRRTVDALLAKCRKPCRLVINKVCRETMLASGVRDLDEVMDLVGVPLLSVLPFDPYINADGSRKRDARRSVLSQQVFDAMARRVTGEYVPLMMDTV